LSAGRLAEAYRFGGWGLGFLSVGTRVGRTQQGEQNSGKIALRRSWWRYRADFTTLS